MRKALGGVVLVAMASTGAVALPLQTDSFVHEKTGYVVYTRTVGEVMYLRGKHPVTGETFRLKVSSSGRTSGTFAGKPVEMVVRDGTTEAQVAAQQDSYLTAGGKYGWVSARFRR